MPTYSKELDIEVHVTVDGEPIREYIDGDAASDSDVITRYVEAIAGSEFEIAYTISGSHPTGKDMRVRCRVDGTIVRKPVHQFERGSWHKDCVMSGVRKRQGTAEMMRMFRFKTIAVGPKSGNVVDTTTTLGSIKLEFQSGTAKRGGKLLRAGRLLAAQEISEKSLKGEAKSLCTEFGTAKHCPFPKTYKFEADEKTFVTFVFKYRTRANLQALHIIPREISPASLANSQVASDPSNPASAASTAIKKEVEEERANSCIEDDTSAPDTSPITSLSTTTPAPRSGTAISFRHNPDTVPHAASSPKGLAKEEVIAMIIIHRGHDVGLANQSTKSLLGLLKYYEDKETVGTDTASGDRKSARSIKRGYQDDSGLAALGSSEKKREVIVLDD